MGGGQTTRAATSDGSADPSTTGASGQALVHRRTPRWLAAGSVLGIAAAALVLRLASWRDVFGGPGIRLISDGDPYYHVRRIRMILEQGAIVWRDPWLNYPLGADIPWPPLFDLAVAGACWAVGLGHPSPDTILAVAAVAPVVLGLVGIALGAALAAEILGPAAGAGVALLLSVSRPLVSYGQLGRPDQHVMEILLFSAAALVFARGLRDERLRAGRAVLFGVVLALSFWNWLGSAVTLFVFGASCVVAGVVIDPRRAEWGRAARLFAWGSAAAAAALLVSIAFAGPAGALRGLTLGGLSGFQVVLCALAALLAASLLPLGVRPRLARAALLVAVPAGIIGLVLLVIPAVREPVLRGLTAAGTGNAWYGSIREFMPTVFSGMAPVREELFTVVRTFGFWPLVAVPGMYELWLRMRENSTRAGAILFAFVIAAVFFVATARMQRFQLYGSLPLAIFSWAGLALVRRRVEALRRGAGAIAASLIAAAAFAPPTIAFWGLPSYRAVPPVIDEALERLRDPSADGFQIAVLAPWYFGHHVLLSAERPVIASPFGTEGGVGAMEDLTAFFVESNPDAAERLLLRRGVRYVLLRSAVEDMARLVGHGVRSIDGVQAPPAPAFDRIPDLISYRLYLSGGMAIESPMRPALEGFRLVDEVHVFFEEKGEPIPIRIFELVPGATIRIRGGTAGRRLVARTDLTSPFGQQGEWWTQRILDGRGEASLRVPYATGLNGSVSASAFVLSDGTRSGRIRITEEQVAGGAELVLDLSRP